MSDVQVSESVLRMRRQFDDSFALTAEVHAEQRVRMLAIRAGGDAYVLPLDGVDGVIADRGIVPVPTAVPFFLGLIGHRGALIPVFDLAAMLGYPSVANPRWIALARSGELPVGFAFETFEAQLDLAARAEETSAPHSGRHIAGVVRTGDGSRPLLGISSLLAALPRGGSAIRKEK